MNRIFGLNGQGAGETNALFHAAGEFLGVGVFEPFNPTVSSGAKARRCLSACSMPGQPAALRRFPAPSAREKGETLKHDATLGGTPATGRPCHRTSPPVGGSVRKACAAASIFPTRGAEQSHDVAGSITRSWAQSPAPAAIGPMESFFDCARFDNALCRRRGERSRYGFRPSAFLSGHAARGFGREFVHEAPPCLFG